VNTFERSHKSFLGHVGNSSPKSKIQGSLGKILSNEDLKYLSIRSETPRPEGASRHNSSKRKLLQDEDSLDVNNDIEIEDLIPKVSSSVSNRLK